MNHPSASPCATSPFAAPPPRSDADVADPRAAPLVSRLVAQCGAHWVDAGSHDAFVGGSGDRVLFFSGDAVRFPESLDVAVVLPELQAALRRPDGSLPFLIGVVCRDHEDALARRWASQRWPALVFVRDGAYVGNLPGMQDWLDYVSKVRELLAAPTSRAPGVGISVVAAGVNGTNDTNAGSGCH
jgi:hydrogenase-1 operon protein HyaE